MSSISKPSKKKKNTHTKRKHLNGNNRALNYDLEGKNFCLWSIVTWVTSLCLSFLTFKMRGLDLNDLQ